LRLLESGLVSGIEASPRIGASIRAPHLRDRQESARDLLPEKLVFGVGKSLAVLDPHLVGQHARWCVGPPASIEGFAGERQCLRKLKLGQASGTLNTPKLSAPFEGEADQSTRRSANYDSDQRVNACAHTRDAYALAGRAFSRAFPSFALYKAVARPATRG
jgi:hypothetical protein